jgi:hypothetical protein
MKKLLVAIALLGLYPFGVKAQLNLAFPPSNMRGGAMNALATDWQTIGINPANLGWDTTKLFAMSLVNLGISAQADHLNIAGIQQIAGGDTNMLKELISSHGGPVLNANLTLAAFSFKVPIVGNFAISLTDRAYANFDITNLLTPSDFPTIAAAIAATALSYEEAHGFTKNVDISGVDSATRLDNLLSSFDGSHIVAYEYRELYFAYGRQFLKIPLGDTLKFYGGFDIGYIMGLANVYGGFNNGALTAEYAVGSSQQLTSLFPSGPGKGYSLDLGLSATYKKWAFGVSVTNIGSINWTGTKATLNDTSIVRKIIESQIDSNSNSLNNLFETSSTTFTTVLPSQTRLGASYALNKFFTFASDIVIPLNNAPGNINTPYFSAATCIHPCKILYFDAGFSTAKGYGVAMPLGIGFGHRVQTYLGVNDLFSYLGKSKNSDLSFVLGLIRINI